MRAVLEPEGRRSTSHCLDRGQGKRILPARGHQIHRGVAYQLKQALVFKLPKVAHVLIQIRLDCPFEEHLLAGRDSPDDGQPAPGEERNPHGDVSASTAADLADEHQSLPRDLAQSDELEINPFGYHPAVASPSVSQLPRLALAGGCQNKLWVPGDEPLKAGGDPTMYRVQGAVADTGEPGEQKPFPLQMRVNDIKVRRQRAGQHHLM